MCRLMSSGRNPGDTYHDTVRTLSDGSYFVPVPKEGWYTVTITTVDDFGATNISKSRIYVKLGAFTQNANSISGKVYYVVSHKPVVARHVKVFLQMIGSNGGLHKSSDSQLTVATTDSTVTDSTGMFVFPVDSQTIAQTSTFRIITSDRYAVGRIDITNMTPGKYIIDANIPVDLTPSILLRKTADKSVADVKDIVTYTVLVADTGTWSTSNSILVDSLGKGMHLLGVSSNIAGIPIDTTNSRIIKWTIGILDSLGGTRDSILFTVKVKFDDSISVSQNVTNSVIFTSDMTSRILAQATTDVVVPQLQITKQAFIKIINIGDVATYQISVTNNTSNMTLDSVQVTDYPPLGFKYIAGSTFIGSQKVSDPKVVGKKLNWIIANSLKSDSTVSFVYRLVAGAGAAEGNGINTAQASAKTPSGQIIQSVVVNEQVEVRLGIFTDHGIIIGKIFYDNNRNAYQDPGEEGVKGIELVMEDGTRIVTGDDGKYSLPDVLPGMHVIKVRKHTLPKDAELVTGYNDFAGDPSSRFVDLTPSGIARVDFYLKRTLPDTLAFNQSIAKVGDMLIQRIAQPRNIVFIEDEKPAPMKLTSLNFDVAKATLRPDAFPTIKQLAEILIDYPDITATIVGHTDSSPIHTKEFPSNTELSYARANSVKQYLAQKEGIDTSRIKTIGYGEFKPIATTSLKMVKL